FRLVVFSLSLCFSYPHSVCIEIYTLSLHDALPILREIMRIEFSDEDEEKGRKYFSKLMKLNKKSVYKIPGPVDLKFLNVFYKQFRDDNKELDYKPFDALKWNATNYIFV